MEAVPLRKQLDALFWIMRPLNAITASVAVYLATFLAVAGRENPIDPLSYVFIMAAAFLTTAQANTHNDIIDIEVDRINAPERPLPSNILTKKMAWTWAIFLFSLALLTGLLADLRMGLVFPFSLFWATLNSLILDAYNVWFKKNGLLGNMVVGYAVGALFIYADILINGTFTMQITLLGVFVFFLNWGREVIKGIRDIEGDRAEGIRTIGVRYGAKGAAVVGSGIISLGIISNLPLVFTSENPAVVGVLVAFDLILIYKSIRLIRDPTADRAQKTKKLYLQVMLFAMLAFIVIQFLDNTFSLFS